MNTALPPPIEAYPVYAPMWEYFQQALWRESKQLSTEIAESLGVSAKPLLEALAKTKKKSCYLVQLDEPTQDNFLCQALTTTSEVAQRCRKPVVYGELYCPCHRGWLSAESFQQKPQYRRLKGGLGEGHYFLDVLTQQLYDANHNRVGHIHENKAIVFEIEEEGQQEQQEQNTS